MSPLRGLQRFVYYRPWADAHGYIIAPLRGYACFQTADVSDRQMHIIRLRGPWQRLEVNGAVRWSRRFGKPTGLQAREQVRLVIDSAVATSATISQVRLNGEPLTTELVGQFRYNLTRQLLPRNELTIDHRGPTNTPPENVRLEISAD